MNSSPYHRFNISSLVSLFAAFAGAHAGTGDLDSTFGGSGIVYSPVGDSPASSVVVQRDGKIVVSGDGILIRYNPDGSLDTSFNGTGKIALPGRSVTRDGKLALQDDGKIIVAGARDFLDTAIMRYNADGTLDSDFNGTGSVVSDFGGSDWVESVSLQSDGKIVVAGGASDDGAISSFLVARYHPNGRIDKSFNNTGRALANFGRVSNHATDVAVQEDGKIIVAGFSSTSSGSDSRVAVARYTPDGQLDLTFNGTGKATSTIEGVGNALALQKDGKIVVAGYTSAETTDRQNIMLARLEKDGSPDLSFNGSGFVVTPFGITSSARDVAIQPDGKIVVAGISMQGGSGFDYALLRYNGDGSLDSTFKGSGRTATPVTGGEGNAVALQTDGKIIVAGRMYENGEGFAVVRYQGGPYPNVVLEAPAGHEILDGATFDFGPVELDVSRTFTIRNVNETAISGLSLTVGAAGNPSDFVVGLPAETTLEPNAATTFAVNFSPTGSGARTTSIEIASSAPDEKPFTLHLTGTRATALENWRRAHFGSPYDTGEGADLNDPDGDGIPNLLEFATASNPLSFTPPIGEVQKNGSTLEFIYTRPKLAVPELNYRLEWTESLGAWTTFGGTVIEVLADDGSTQVVKHKIPAGSNGKRFVRLRVTKK
jgi:uncharacterized delta-60 repeat protein